MNTPNFVFTQHSSLRELIAYESAWDLLRSDNNPFTRFRYLLALEESGSVSADTGWQPLHVALWRLDDAGEKTLEAACPLYLKAHSYGEYVFDWAWARAYEEHGLPYYPKLLSAIPFTPVPGDRLLARDDAARTALLQAILTFCQSEGLPSLHLLFVSDADRSACTQTDLMLRSGVQFHWQNTGWESFESFLQSLKRDKRKKIQQEQRKVADVGITFTVTEGADMTDADWDFFYRCYTQTYLEHGNAPYLTREFFHAMQTSMPENWLLFTAHHGAENTPIACSLIALSTDRQTAYGRYWGALARADSLHFDACYYQPLSWCIANKVQRFEGGAQGEHKMSRALMPTPTASAHWIAHPQFSAAIGRFLEQERQGVAEYKSTLLAHSPFKPNN